MVLEYFASEKKYYVCNHSATQLRRRGYDSGDAVSRKTHLSPNMTSEMQPSKAGGGVRFRLEGSSGGTPPRNSPPRSGAWMTPERRGSWPLATTTSETRSCSLRDDRGQTGRSAVPPVVTVDSYWSNDSLKGSGCGAYDVQFFTTGLTTLSDKFDILQE